MTATKLVKPLADLFRAAGAAHHHAYIQTDGADPEWPLWYAGYLQGPLGRLLNTEFTQSELVYLLVLADRTRQEANPAPAWPEYYAQFFIERYAQGG